MLLLDAFLIGQARLLPEWLRSDFRVDHLGSAIPAGSCGPTGILLLVIAASPWSKLPRLSQAVLAAIAVRAGFIFLAVGVPALFVTIIKRLIGRARPYVSEITDPYSYDPVHLESFLCQPAFRACHQCFRRCRRDRGALAEGAASHVDLCRGNRDEPGGGERAFSQRRHCRGRCRDWWARCWCAAGSPPGASA